MGGRHMRYYSSHPGTTNPKHEKIRFFHQHGIYLMVSAAHWSHSPLNYALDNGAWSDFINGRPFDHNRFLKVLDKIRSEGTNPEFVVLPDIVSGGIKSLELSREYLYLSSEFACYIAVQDGMLQSHLDPYLSKISGIFVGGSTSWKWRTAELWSQYAHKNDLYCHIGRVGTFRNLLRSIAANVDSVDGSNLIRNGKYHLIPQYLADCNSQTRLEDFLT